MRRDRLQIWTEILEAIEEEQRRDSRVRPTRVQSAANLPHDRFWGHFLDLQERGLVTKEPLGITNEGHAFLRRYHDFQRFIAQYRIHEAPPARTTQSHEHIMARFGIEMQDAAQPPPEEAASKPAPIPNPSASGGATAV